ncbi:MAG: hypothetical protein GX154_03680 [Clostridiales bacterium]|nr:hypothetical protein [Clostridiales bacterium]
MKKSFVFKSSQCTGCRACELACSMHHRKIFDPNVSSIHINKVEDGFEIVINNMKSGQRLACDLCGNEGKEKQCVKYCSPLFKKELEKYFDIMVGGNTEKDGGESI